MINTNKNDPIFSFKKKEYQRINWSLILILGYLFVGIFVAGFSRYVYLPIMPSINSAIQVLMYLLITCLIWSERHDLDLNNIDKKSVLVFSVFGLFLCFDYGTGLLSGILDLIIVGCNIFIWVNVFRKKICFNNEKNNLKNWVSLGLALTLWLSLIGTLPSLKLVISILEEENNPLLRISFLIFGMFDYLKNASILEEPIYRGFLWGYLRNKHWEEKRILLFQTALFTVSHFYYFKHPLTIFIMLPLAGLLFGYITMKSRSLIPAMLSHALYNATSFMLILKVFPFPE